MDAKRRQLLSGIGTASAALILNGCAGSNSTQSANKSASKPEDKNKNEIEVTATEDLMREHGILRRALLVYTAAATNLRNNPTAVAPDALQKTARLFRAFGEEYHEKKLEEAYIFPAVKRAGGVAASLADILITQHQRGREITDYIIAVTQAAKLGASNVGPLAQAMDALVLMYRHHAAREDTIIFPAWKQTLTPDQYDEMTDKFEDLEHEQFGADGFEDAVQQIGEIEQSLSLSDLARFTAPAPPKP